MGDMREEFDALKEMIKERKERRNKYYEPILIKLGAICKSDAVYEYKDWLCYPTKGFAMLKKNNRIRCSLRKLLKEGL